MVREKLIFKVETDVFNCADSDAVAFVTAHETATGVQMENTQREAVCTLVGMLKGTGTTNGSDLWTLLTTRGSYLHILCPSSNSVASANGYSIELLSASSVGTFNNFIAGDFTPSGLSGGTTKYFDLGVAPSAWALNDAGLAFYVLSLASASSLIGASDSNQHVLRIGVSPATIAARVNNTAYGTIPTVSGIGLYHVERVSSTQQQKYFNGSFINTEARSSTTQPTVNAYSMAFNNAGSPASEFNGLSGGWAFNLPQMTDNEAQDFYDSLSTYQSNVITGGR